MASIHQKWRQGFPLLLIRACGEGYYTYIPGGLETWVTSTHCLFSDFQGMAVSTDPKTWTYNLL